VEPLQERIERTTAGGTITGVYLENNCRWNHYRSILREQLQVEPLQECIERTTAGGTITGAY
jgi:hypothetical protein